MLHTLESLSNGDLRLLATVALAEHLTIHSVERHLWFHKEGTYEHLDIRMSRARIGSCSFASLAFLIQSFEGHLLLKFSELTPDEGDAAAADLTSLVGQYPLTEDMIGADVAPAGAAFFVAALGTADQLLAMAAPDLFPDGETHQRWMERGVQLRQIALASLRRYATVFLGQYHERLSREWLAL